MGEQFTRISTTDDIKIITTGNNAEILIITVYNRKCRYISMSLKQREYI